MKNAKKTQKKSLVLAGETLRVLSVFQLSEVNGGDTVTQSNNGCGTTGTSGKQTGCSACVF